jgi:hypothetical protein
MDLMHFRMISNQLSVIAVTLKIDILLIVNRG